MSFVRVSCAADLDKVEAAVAAAAAAAENPAKPD
jgi:hypothetical protein